jgi:hypothetical protein
MDFLRVLHIETSKKAKTLKTLRQNNTVLHWQERKQLRTELDRSLLVQLERMHWKRQTIVVYYFFWSTLGWGVFKLQTTFQNMFLVHLFLLFFSKKNPVGASVKACAYGTPLGHWFTANL